MDLDTHFTNVKSYIEGVEKVYVDKYLSNPLASPDDYDLDVKTYCILCHAAFEEFAEEIALEVLEKTIDNYIYSRKITIALVNLLHFKSNKSKAIDDKDYENKPFSIFDHCRKSLEEIKSAVSNEIENNHGVSLKYLNKILIPVGIEVPNDLTLLESLKKLALERGAYAHKRKEKDKKTFKKSLSPEESKSTVQDCLKLFEEIKNRAKLLL